MDLEGLFGFPGERTEWNVRDPKEIEEHIPQVGRTEWGRYVDYLMYRSRRTGVSSSGARSV